MLHSERASACVQHARMLAAYGPWARPFIFKPLQAAFPPHAQPLPQQPGFDPQHMQPPQPMQYEQQQPGAYPAPGYPLQQQYPPQQEGYPPAGGYAAPVASGAYAQPYQDPAWQQQYGQPGYYPPQPYMQPPPQQVLLLYRTSCFCPADLLAIAVGVLHPWCTHAWS